MTDDSPTKDVREMSVEELMDVYDDFRDEAEYLPSDDPQCVKVELEWALAHQVFGNSKVS